MKRYLSLIAATLCLLTAFPLSACSVLRSFIVSPSEAASEPTDEVQKGFAPGKYDEYLTVSKKAYQPSPHYDPIHCTVSYDLLNASQQLLYDRLLENAYTVNTVTDSDSFRFWDLFRCEQVVLEDMILSEDEVKVVVRAVYDDHPELFWITNYFDYMADEDENYCAVILYSCYSPNDIKQWLPKVREASDAFMADVPEGLSEYERELTVHDYLIDNCYYNESDTNILEFYHSVYGVLVKGKAVCEGYAKAFQMLLNLLGVECVVIEGEGVDPGEEPDYDDDVLHMWNAVKLGGEWYFVDVTWDDSDDDARRHVYLNGSAESFRSTHIPSKLVSELSEEELHKKGTYWSLPLNIFVPDCTATEYTYMIHECARLTSYYDSGAVIDAMTESAKAEENSFLLYIDPSFTSVDDALDNLILEYPQYIFDYVDSVNYRLSDSRIDTQQIGYDYDEDMHYIIFFFDYE